MLELLRSGVIMESENFIFSGFRFFPGTLHDQVILRFHASAVFRRCESFKIVYLGHSNYFNYIILHESIFL